MTPMNQASYFEGTIDDFHKFVGPYIKNKIPALTRKLRNGRRCEDCGAEVELQSAHVDGKRRREIVAAVLNEYRQPDGSVHCPIAEVVTKVMDAHTTEMFRFLCDPCHKRYDRDAALKGAR